MRRALLVAAALVAALSACNAIVDFDEPPQPCNPAATTDAEDCLEGYVCKDGVCVKAEAPASDEG